jgi:hypothetical protein
MTNSSPNYSFENFKKKIITYFHYISKFFKIYIKQPIYNCLYKYCIIISNDEIDENISNKCNNETVTEPKEMIMEDIDDEDMIIRKVSYSDINETHEISISRSSISKHINLDYIQKSE